MNLAIIIFFPFIALLIQSIVNYRHSKNGFLFMFYVELGARCSSPFPLYRWLGTGARRLFGNVCENVVTLVVDVSGGTLPYFSLLKEHVRRLFNEQLVFADWMNMVAFNDGVYRYFEET